MPACILRFLQRKSAGSMHSRTAWGTSMKVPTVSYFALRSAFLRGLALAVMLVILTGQRAWAVTPGTPTNGLPWVVPLSSTSVSAGFVGSGSYITNGVVLTCSHNVAGGFSDSVVIGGQSYFALGVQDPLYAGGGGDPNDIGLYLVLNQPNVPTVPWGFAPVLATPADPQLTVGSTVSVLGYGKSPPGGLPLIGTMTMTNGAVTMAGTGISNVTANTYAFVQPPSQSLTDPGDSGGPYIANIGGTYKIVAVHTTGYTSPGGAKTGASGVRVDTHLDFVTGNGQNMGGGVYASALDRMTNTTDTAWSAATSWARTSTNFNLAPQANDIAILDPTQNSDAGITVTLDVTPPNLNGLLSDVTLKVNSGKALNVVGVSGALNGGLIDIGGATAGGVNIGFGLDNEGTVTLRANGTANLGSSFPVTTNTTALYNGTNATFAVTGGVASVAVSVYNGGTLSVSAGGAITMGASLPQFTTNIFSMMVTAVVSSTSLFNDGSANTSVGNGTLSAATALQNFGTFTVASNGTAYIGGNLPALLTYLGNPNFATAVYNFTNST